MEANRGSCTLQFQAFFIFHYQKLELHGIFHLSSNVFEANVEILGGTFLGSLGEHATTVKAGA